MEDKTAALKKNARIAGWWYLITMVPSGYGLAYVRSKIIVEGNVAATINNILIHEFLFRTGIVSQFITAILFVLLASVLYRLLKQVNECQAKLMVAFVLVQVPMIFLIETFNITSLMILKGNVLEALQPGQKQDLATLFLNIHEYGTITLKVFWGLWLIPFGQLVYKSGFIPRLIGACLIIGGIGWVLDTFTFVLFPGYYSFVFRYTVLSGAIGELPIILWLLIKGVRVQKSAIAS